MKSLLGLPFWLWVVFGVAGLLAAGYFIREQVRPHVESGKSKVGKLAEAVAREDDPARREFLEERIDRLKNWMKRGGLLLPLLQKMMGE